MRINWSRHVPPGYDFKPEQTLLFSGIGLSILYSLFTYGNHLSNQLALLYWVEGSVRVLREGAVMPDFVEILDGTLTGYFLFSWCFAAQIVAHYVYHYRESKSIYTMRRLPKRWELHRRCLTVPLVAIVTYLSLAFVTLLICYAVYMNVTPDVCLTPGQWQKIWSV